MTLPQLSFVVLSAIEANIVIAYHTRHCKDVLFVIWIYGICASTTIVIRIDFPEFSFVLIATSTLIRRSANKALIPFTILAMV